MEECGSAPWHVQVSFQWKNPDFLLKNADFRLKNVDFITRQVTSNVAVNGSVKYLLWK